MRVSLPKDLSRLRDSRFNATTLRQSGLQKKYQQTNLPDHFSKGLGLTPTDDVEENLRELEKRHKELSGRHVNWLGTYLHAEQVWQKGMEYQKTKKTFQ